MSMKTDSQHILIFEPQTRGHHLSWLRFIAEDFLSAGMALSIAADLRPDSEPLVRQQLADLLPRIQLLSAYDNTGKWRKGSRSGAIGDCFKQSNADEVFMTNFDEVASSWLRRASVGIYPPAILNGKISGVYFRPRFLENPYLPPGNMIKSLGFKRLCRKGWLKRIFLLDEGLFEQTARYDPTRFYLLPDPWIGNFSTSQTEARKILNIPSEKFIFLHYGVGDRRKGLHIAIRAMLRDPAFFLLCAGRLGQDRNIFNGLQQLEESGQAKIINDYLSDDESDICFCACDAVLLPYIRHFGSSGVLSKAAAAGKPVIVSDKGLLARRVSEHHLGMIFASGNADALYESAKQLFHSDIRRFQQPLSQYGQLCSRTAFRKSLLTAVQQ